MSDPASHPAASPDALDVAGAPALRLVVDGLFQRPGRIGGIEFMFSSLLAALAETKGSNDRVSVLLPEGVRLPARRPFDELETVAVPRFGNRFSTLERHLVRDRDVALFPNYYTPWSARLGRRRASVTVIHDLQFRTFPENFTLAKRTFQHLAIRHTCRRADTVVAISGFTADEVATFQPAARDRLTVIRNPIEWARFDVETAPAGHDLDGRPFLLLAAAQYRHKNIATVLESFGPVRTRHPEARLVLVGQVPEGLGETKVSAPLARQPGVIQLGFVPDSELSWLYRRATAVVVPSLYEGCGLPAAEALGLGTPVLHSGRGALPEVVGGAGVAVADPLAPAAWSDAMSGAIEGRPARPTPETVSSMRDAHDPVRIGRHYWAAIRAAGRTRTAEQ